MCKKDKLSTNCAQIVHNYTRNIYSKSTQKCRKIGDRWILTSDVYNVDERVVKLSIKKIWNEFLLIIMVKIHK